MPRRHKVVRAHVIGNSGQNGGGAVCCGNACGNALTGFNGNGKVGAETRAVALRHKGQVKPVDHLWRHGQADKPPAIFGHKVDGLRGNKLRGHGQVTFILPALVVHKNDHFALLYVGNGFLNAAQWHDASFVWPVAGL